MAEVTSSSLVGSTSEKRQFAGKKRGIEGVKHIVSWLRAAFRDPHYDIEEILAEGDRVAVRVIFSGTHEGSLWASLRVAGVSLLSKSTGCVLMKMER
jgi:predicted ester cyclase